MPLHKNLTGTELHEPKGADSATSGTFYKANGAGSGSWSALTGTDVALADAGTYFTTDNVEAALQQEGLIRSTYGGMYITANTTSETATGSAYDTWTTGWVQGTASNITVNTGSGYLLVPATGVYLLNTSISFYQDAGSAAVWLFAAAQNGTQITKTVCSHTTSGTDTQTINLTGLLSLTANDQVSLVYNRTSGTPDPIINYCNFVLNRIT